MTENSRNYLPLAKRITKDLQRYFIDCSTDCPYSLPYKAVYNQAIFDTMPDYLMDVYLASGFRRNGNAIYSMRCPDCQACIPIRLEPREFKPDRSQKRVWEKNSDISVEITPLACSLENLELLDTFLQTRFPGREGTAHEYYTGFFLNHITSTVEFRYRVHTRLIGVAVVDVSPLWLNVVFFYFDPEEGKRSPGTYNILYLIDFCRQKKIPYIYLGYWIKDVKAMRYKARFKPHYILCGSDWRRVAR